MEQTTCAFCNEQTTDYLTVTDLDGIKHIMCRECLENKDSDVICQCGSTEFAHHKNGFVRCADPDCNIIREENEFYYLSYSMKAREENYKQTRLEYKQDKELCDIVFRLLRAEFDKVGTHEPFLSYNAAELIKLRNAAKKLVIGRAIISRDKIDEMENDLNG